MSYSYPTVTEFKERFDRDFPYGSNIETSVRDIDITRAMDRAKVNFNEAFFGSEEDFKLGFLYLSAHHLVLNLRNSSQGLSGQFSWLQNSRGAGSVSEGLSIPTMILENPYFAAISKTGYGAEFLIMVLPQLFGNIYTVKGATNP